MEIVVLPESALFLLRLHDVVLGRATAAVAVGDQKYELALVRRLEMWAIDEHVVIGVGGRPNHGVRGASARVTNKSK